jgi:hypothetical protein
LADHTFPQALVFSHRRHFSGPGSGPVWASLRNLNLTFNLRVILATGTSSRPLRDYSFPRHWPMPTGVPYRAPSEPIDLEPKTTHLPDCRTRNSSALQSPFSASSVPFSPLCGRGWMPVSTLRAGGETAQ